MHTSINHMSMILVLALIVWNDLASRPLLSSCNRTSRSLRLGYLVCMSVKEVHTFYLTIMLLNSLCITTTFEARDPDYKVR